MFKDRNGNLTPVGWGCVAAAIAAVCIVGYNMMKPKPKVKADLNPPIVLVLKAPSIVPA